MSWIEILIQILASAGTLRDILKSFSERTGYKFTEDEEQFLLRVLEKRSVHIRAHRPTSPTGLPLVRVCIGSEEVNASDNDRYLAYVEKFHALSFLRAYGPDDEWLRSPARYGLSWQLQEWHLAAKRKGG